MPRENKKRGRRMESKKRKHDEDVDLEDADIADSSKRLRPDHDHDHDHDQAPVQDDSIPVEGANDEGFDAAYPALDTPFYGMLDDEEQEYFKRADDMLENNSFGDNEERDLFLANVYREAEGKELKIANSQSCSRLMERLIQLSSPVQLSSLFQRFTGQFPHLMTHRFASHCCEALFLRAAPFVTEDLLAKTKKSSKKVAASDEEAPRSLESLFLDVIGELEGNVGFLMVDRFASHVLRVLLLVLSGEPLSSTATKSLVQSRRKEGVKVAGGEKKADGEEKTATRTVPKSFSSALEKLIKDSVAGLDTARLRALATHQIGNPTLQLLLRLELVHYGKQHAKDDNSIIRKLLPDDPITSESDSAAFFSGMVYDPIGSHLVETIVQCAPAKLWKQIYQNIVRERLPSYSRNEVADYVACRVLERLGRDDLLEAHEAIAPLIPSLLQRNRTGVVRTLIERCVARGVDTQALAVQVDSTWHGPDGFEIKKLLKIDQTTDGAGSTPHDSAQSSTDGPRAATGSTHAREPVKVHFNILAQSMLVVPGSLSALVLDALICLDADSLVSMAKDPIVSRTLQAALTSKNTSIVTTRKLVQHFYGHIGDISLDKAASHVVDCIWEGTHGLAFIRERIAEELAENEAQLRDSVFGRAVWKNWKMDIYKRRRGEWIRQSKMKASNDGFQSFADVDANKAAEGTAKTPLELARERHAKEKAAKEKAKEKASSGDGKEQGQEQEHDRGRTRRETRQAEASASAAVRPAATTA